LAKSFEEKYNVKALSVKADLSKPEAPQHVVDSAKAHFSDASGRFQIDIIVNNAAIVNAQAIDQLDLDMFDATFNLNCKAPALLVKAAFPYLPTDRYNDLGSVVADVICRYKRSSGGYDRKFCLCTATACEHHIDLFGSAYGLESLLSAAPSTRWHLGLWILDCMQDFQRNRVRR
jgi:NAD(P)-dependent dehydrogenase (short-subunit alcohol dehydrogenase family)